MTTATQLRSIGRIACEVQRSVQQVLKVASSADIRPEVELDGVRYYSAADAERLVQAVYEQQPRSRGAL